MAFITIENINILGISAAVPKKKITNTDSKFISTTGILERRIVSSNVCTSDLCFSAAEKIIEDLNIDKEDINVLIFVSQTPDYKLPVTSTILQHKLKLPQSCLCFDIPLGCSGFIYGLATISSLISSGKIKKGLLLVGDTISKTVQHGDQSTEPLFGDAGTATVLEYDVTAEPMLFDLGSDGEGYKTIIIPGGGSRDKSASEYLVLDGMDVFNFGIIKMPKVINGFLSKYSLTVDQIDLFVFHQANKFMNDKIYKKLSIPESKTLSSLTNFGNTSSATIPLTIITNQPEHIKKDKSLLFCGFGVGLSWGTVFIKLTKNIHCSTLIEI